MQDVLLRRFQPLHLKLEGVGPFRSAFELPLTAKDGAPANFFLLVSRNGFGKTTVLEVIHGLIGALGLEPWSSEEQWLDRYLHPDLLTGGRAQLDIRVELETGGRASAALVSVFIGSDLPPLIVTPSRLEQAGVDRWIPLRLEMDDLSALDIRVVDPQTRPIIEPLLAAIRVGNLADRRFMPGGDSLFLPTALHFTADRRILQPPPAERAIRQPGPAYAPAHRFATDGATWETSLDGLLVWYEWMGNSLFDNARTLVNDLLFAEGGKRLDRIDHHALTAVIDVEREDGTIHSHGIDRLSHGERSLMHLLVRTAYHRAGSTILLIDELETHLHPKWQLRLMALLKEWIRDWPDLTVIATTHNPELLEAFAFEREEEGLVKGGHLIEAGEL